MSTTRSSVASRIDSTAQDYVPDNKQLANCWHKRNPDTAPPYTFAAVIFSCPPSAHLHEVPTSTENFLRLRNNERSNVIHQTTSHFAELEWWETVEISHSVQPAPQHYSTTLVPQDITRGRTCPCWRAVLQRATANSFTTKRYESTQWFEQNSGNENEEVK